MTSASQPSSKKRRVLAASSLAVLLAAGGAAITLRPLGAETRPAAAQPQAMPVPVATVEPTEVRTWDEFSGRLEAVERVEIRSRVAGTVKSVHFTEGALVQKGELLIRIDPDPYQAEVARAQAQLLAAEARLRYASSERERAKRLWQESAIAQRELDERVNAQAEADANLRAAQAALQSAKLNLGYTEVRAPVSGRVGRLEVTVGNLVAAGPEAPVLTTLVSVSPIYASFDADERVVSRALGQGAPLAKIPVEVQTALGGEPRHGHLQLIDNHVDPKSGTVRVRALLDNRDGALIPGQYVSLRMGRPKAERALLVNEGAVGTDQSKRFVLVVGEDNKAVYREVKLGGTVRGRRIVTSGLEPGERIIVNGLQRVRPGSLIAPQPVAEAS